MNKQESVEVQKPTVAVIEAEIAVLQADQKRISDEAAVLEQELIDGEDDKKKLDQLVRLNAQQRIYAGRMEGLQRERRAARGREIVAEHQGRALNLRELVTELHDLEQGDEFQSIERRYIEMMKQRADLRRRINIAQRYFHDSLQSAFSVGEGDIANAVGGEIADVDKSIQDILDTTFLLIPEWE